MKALVFDTETSGMVDFKSSSQSGNQPHLVQLGMVLADLDTWQIKNRMSTIVNLPNGFKMDDKAKEAHGISEEDCASYGVMRAAAIGMFNQLAARAHYLVAFNIDFDTIVIDSVRHRVSLDTGKELVSYTDRLPKICAMKVATDVLKLPGRWEGTYKWPKLNEAYKHFYGEDIKGWHDALVDAEACFLIFKKLVEGGHVKL